MFRSCSKKRAHPHYGPGKTAEKTAKTNSDFSIHIFILFYISNAINILHVHKKRGCAVGDIASSSNICGNINLLSFPQYVLGRLET